MEDAFRSRCILSAESNRGGIFMDVEHGLLHKPADLDARALTAQASEIDMENLISDFKPYFAHVATKYAIRSLDSHKDELFNVAQMAFYEAIQGFDRKRGHFFPFAKLVVRNNVVDYIRKNYRKNEHTVPLEDSYEVDGRSVSNLLSKVSIEQYEGTLRQKRLSEELQQFRLALATWKISMESLVKESPKHKTLAGTYKGVVQMIMNNAEILNTIRNKHYLPVKEISKISGLPQKKIERARTFILAAILIKIGDYDFLSDYVEGWGSFESNHNEP